MSYLTIIHRFIFLSLNLLIFGSALKIVKQFTSKQVLFLFVAYMFMNRFFPIIGRSTWLDQFLTLFGFLSILFWIKYLNERKNAYLITAGILNGLVMLTKYAGWFFPLIIIGLSIIYSSRKKIDLKKLFLPLVLFLSISLVTFILLYPAVWVDPKRVLLLRFEDTSAPIKKMADIWEYLREIRLIDPVLILGFIFTILDWIKKRQDFLHFIGVAGVLYISVYLFTFLILILLGKLDYPFLLGIYRYTFPAIPLLALYTFSRYKVYINNENLRMALILFLFVREIIFSPFLLF